MFLTKEDISILVELSINTPNDFEFGGKVRSIFPSKSITLLYSNDYELGNKTRTFLEN